MNNQSIDGRLLFAQNAISNAMNIQEVASSLALFGYDVDRLKEGEALYTRTVHLQNQKVKEYGEQYTATDALNLAKANKEYMIHLKIARLALKGNRGVAESLQLSGDRKQSLSGWLKQSKAFYTNALNSPEVLSELGRYAIDKEKLTAVQKLITEVETKYNKQLKEKGEAQTATQLRDEAFDDLQEWISDFMAIARIALQEQSQYLEVVGVSVAA